MVDRRLQITVFTGPVDSGKTSRVKLEVKNALSMGKSVGGVFSEARMSGGIKTGYTAVDIRTGRRFQLVSREKLDSDIGTGSFYFSRAAFREISDRILSSISCDILVLDEIGPLELSGGGYAGVVESLRAAFEGELFLVVRDYLLDQLLSRFGLEEWVDHIVYCSINGPASFAPWS